MFRSTRQSNTPNGSGSFGPACGVIVAYLEWIGAQVVLVIPPGNDAGFEPNRSILPSNTPRAQPRGVRQRVSRGP